MDRELTIDAQRLWSRLMAMATIGATPAGGCNRQALTDDDAAGRRQFVDWCEAAGCSVRIDAIGNVFARRPGRDAALAPVLTGSHLDTQPTGGKFDGIFGVLAGLEVIETLNDAGVETDHPIDVVVWTNEEGSRFDAAMMGSAVWAGALSLADAYALTDRAGRTVEQELDRIGFRGSEPAAAFTVEAAFEAHIEQGPLLERADRAIGIVTGAQHMSRLRITVDGIAAHAGTTPMDARKDPMRALADFLPRLYALAAEAGPDARLTFGYISALPGSSNTVPHRLELMADVRHPSRAAHAGLQRDIEACVGDVCGALELACEVRCVWSAAGVEFDAGCVEVVRQAAASAGYEAMTMISGAGHDACNLAAVVPTAMIFIPCAGGLSHNEAESVTPEQVEAGCNVLLNAVLATAGGSLATA